MSSVPERLPSRPLRNWLVAWHIHTGDPFEVIARGFDLPVQLVVELSGGRPPLMIDRVAAEKVCSKLRVAPAVFWPVVSRGSSSGHCQVDPPWSEMAPILAGVFGAELSPASMRMRLHALPE